MQPLRDLKDIRYQLRDWLRIQVHIVRCTHCVSITRVHFFPLEGGVVRVYVP